MALPCMFRVSFSSCIVFMYMLYGPLCLRPCILFSLIKPVKVNRRGFVCPSILGNCSHILALGPKYWCRNPGRFVSQTLSEMANVLESLKSRKGVRSWATRTANQLAELLVEDGVSKVRLEDAVREVENRIAALDISQSKVEALIEDDEQLFSDFDEAANFRDKVRRPVVAALEKIASMEVKMAASKMAAPAGKSTKATEAKLPQLELPRFSGNVIDWTPFWDQYTAIVHNSDLPTVSKFTYLQSLLDGEAKACIQGLSTTGLHYKVACELLVERYGRKERIIFAHIQELLNMTSPLSKPGNRVAGLWALQDSLLSHVRSLEALNVNGKDFGVFLTPVILSRLPHDIRLEWAREGVGKESDLPWLLDFLKKEIQRRERSDAFKDTSHSSSSGNGKSTPERRYHKPGSVATLTSSSEQTHSGSVTCGFCARRHPTYKCWDVLKLSLAERKDRIRACGLCLRCLRKGHFAKSCTCKCVQCHGAHHNIICSDSPSTCNPPFFPVVNESTCKPLDSHVGVAHSQSNINCSVLQTAKVHVKGKSGTVEATLLFDSGSDRSYVTSNLVKKVQPQWVSSQPVSYSAFGEQRGGKNELRHLYKFDLQGIVGGSETLVAVEVPVICSQLARAGIPCNLIETFGSIPFADCYDVTRHISVDILVGLDFYWKFMKQGILRSVVGPVAQETSFGWVVSGSWCNDPIPPSLTSSLSAALLE